MAVKEFVTNHTEMRIIKRYNWNLIPVIRSIVDKVTDILGGIGISINQNQRNLTETHWGAK